MLKKSSTRLPESVSPVGMVSFIQPLKHAMTLMLHQVMDVVAPVKLNPNVTRISMPFLSAFAAMAFGMTLIFPQTKLVMTATLMKTTAAPQPAPLKPAGTATRSQEVSVHVRKKSAETTTWN